MTSPYPYFVHNMINKFTLAEQLASKIRELHRINNLEELKVPESPEEMILWACRNIMMSNKEKREQFKETVIHRKINHMINIITRMQEDDDKFICCSFCGNIVGRVPLLTSVEDQDPSLFMPSGNMGEFLTYKFIREEKISIRQSYKNSVHPKHPLFPRFSYCIEEIICTRTLPHNMGRCETLIGFKFSQKSKRLTRSRSTVPLKPPFYALSKDLISLLGEEHRQKITHNLTLTDEIQNIFGLSTREARYRIEMAENPDVGIRNDNSSITRTILNNNSFARNIW